MDVYRAARADVSVPWFLFAGWSAARSAYTAPLVVSCGDAGESTRLLEQAHVAGDPFTVAVIDGDMPDAAGLALAGSIMARGAEHNTSVVITLAITKRSAVTDLDELGVAGWVPRPVSPRGLIEVLSAVAANEHFELITRRTLRPRRASTEARREMAGQLRVLLVDDNAINQKVAIRTIERLGCRVAMASNGQEAIDMHMANPFDIVFMDLHMPKTDGFEAASEIRRRERGTEQHVPIIAMIASGTKEDRDRCRAAGMDGYIGKPITKKAIARVIEGQLPFGRAVTGG